MFEYALKEHIAGMLSGSNARYFVTASTNYPRIPFRPLCYPDTSIPMTIAVSMSGSGEKKTMRVLVNENIDDLPQAVSLSQPVDPLLAPALKLLRGHPDARLKACISAIEQHLSSKMATRRMDQKTCTRCGEVWWAVRTDSVNYPTLCHACAVGSKNDHDDAHGRRDSDTSGASPPEANTRRVLQRHTADSIAGGGAAPVDDDDFDPDDAVIRWPGGFIQDGTHEDVTTELLGLGRKTVQSLFGIKAPRPRSIQDIYLERITIMVSKMNDTVKSSYSLAFGYRFREDIPMLCPIQFIFSKGNRAFRCFTVMATQTSAILVALKTNHKGTLYGLWLSESDQLIEDKRCISAWYEMFKMLSGKGLQRRSRWHFPTVTCQQKLSALKLQFST